MRVTEDSPAPRSADAESPPPLKGRGKTRFAGYAAVFDRADRGGDVVRRGAFAASLKKRGAVPLLWQHRAGVVIGTIDHLSEDRRGLRVIGTLGGGVEARKVAALLGKGTIDGLSFGYRVEEAERVAGVRELRVLDLVEVSVVADPMQPQARIHALE